MSLQELEKEATALPARQRADLVHKLLDSFNLEGDDVSDEEIMERERKLESGQVQPISHEEFVRRVREARGK